MNSQESDGFTSEEGKRKRDEEATELAKRSRKTLRTPPKQSEDKLDNLTKMLEKIMVEVQEIRKNQEDYQEEIARMKQENNELKKENQKLSQEVKHLKNTVEQIDRDNRKNNIVITGIDINNDDLQKNLHEVFKNQLQVESTIKEIHKIGHKTYKVKLINWNEKENVMKNKSKLRNFGNGKVFINHDLTKTEMEIQGHLRNIATEEKNKGKVVKIGYQKLTIDGKSLKWDREEGQLKEEKESNSQTRTKN